MGRNAYTAPPVKSPSEPKFKKIETTSEISEIALKKSPSYAGEPLAKILEKPLLETYLTIKSLKEQPSNLPENVQQFKNLEKKFLQLETSLPPQSLNTMYNAILKETENIPLIFFKEKISLYDFSRMPLERKDTGLELPYFAVQVGAFRSDINPSYFKGFAPVFIEKTPDGLKKYTAGKFYTLDAAIIAREAIVSRGYKDAFIVAYYRGRRIPIKEAIAIVEKRSSFIASSEVSPQKEQEKPIQSRTELPELSSSTEASISSPLPQRPSSLPLFIYTVQIAALGKQIPLSIFKNAPELWMLKIDRYYKYFSGRFATYGEAAIHRSTLTKYYPDAFITRVPLSAGEKSLPSQKSSTLRLIVGPFGKKVSLKVADLLLSLPSTKVSTISEGDKVYFIIKEIKSRDELQHITEKLQKEGITSYRVEE